MSFAPSSEFLQTNAEARGPAGKAWIERLPAILADCARQWSLVLGDPFPGLSYNYAARVRRADSSAAVLKVCFPDREFATEAAALELFAGHGAVQLLEVDLDRGALLLERLEPGTLLAEMEDDEQTMWAAASVVRQLWRPVPLSHPFPSVADWMAHMADRAPAVAAPGSPYPVEWINRAFRLFADLQAGAPEPVLLHGDVHPGNILAATRQPWLAIDPKGVMGEPAADVGYLLFSPMARVLGGAEPGRLLARRVDQLAEALDLDRPRLRAWGVVRAVLSSFWSLEDHGRGWEPALACAELLGAA